jgi:ABC-type antimicrobial peptide transport system permease subunit
VDVRPLSAQVEATVVQERVMATLVSGFGALALILACTGLYGLLAYTVAQRRREIGIRLALGAQARALIAMILSGAARLVVVGVAVGIPAAWAVARWIESMLFGLKPTDPFAIGGAIALLTAAALTAAFIPAVRASRLDPLITLRHE